MRSHAHTPAPPSAAAMRIRRSRLTSDFVQIPNRTARDARLSWMARGILVELLSRPDGWEATADDLWRASSSRDAAGETRRGVRAAFAELKAAGYLVSERAQLQDGRLGTVLTVYDVPQSTDVPPVGTSVRPGQTPVSAGDTDRPTGGTSAPRGRTPVSAGRTDVPTGGTSIEENRDQKQKENSLSSLSSNGSLGDRDDNERETREVRSSNLEKNLADAYGATPDEVTAILDAARRDGIRSIPAWAASEIGQEDFAERLAELRRASAPAPRRPACGECDGGWLGEDEHGRMVACPTCKPHIAARTAQHQGREPSIVGQSGP